MPRLLASVVVQATAPHEVFVVDDGSTDRTAVVARQAGATVLTALPPPDGWVGKPWACHTGANAAGGSLMVFLDADTELGPDGLDRLLTAHTALAPDGLLSVQPFHRTLRAYEQLSSFCNIVSMMASGAFRPGAQPTSNVAFGPCLVVGSSAYRRAGGHAAVSGQVIEDIHMAQAHRRIAQPVACLAGGTAISFRMYPSGIRQLYQGWTKNLAGGVRLVSPLPMLGAVLWVAACAAVAVILRSCRVARIARSVPLAANCGMGARGDTGPVDPATYRLVPMVDRARLPDPTGRVPRAVHQFGAAPIRPPKHSVARPRHRHRPASELTVPVIELSPLGTAAANVAFWAVAHSSTGYVAHRLPPASLRHDGPLLQLRSVEADGGLYEHLLGVRRWKDRLPEAGALFAGGLSKRNLPSGHDGGLERFALETRRAELGHWMSLVPLPLCGLWNPPIGVALMVAYGFVVNAPFIIVQRYNRGRCQRLLATRARRSRASRSDFLGWTGEAADRTNGRSIP